MPRRVGSESAKNVASSVGDSAPIGALYQQVLWVALIFLHLPVATTFAVMAIPLALEMTGPWDRRAP